MNHLDDPKNTHKVRQRKVLCCAATVEQFPTGCTQLPSLEWQASATAEKAKSELC